MPYRATPGWAGFFVCRKVMVTQFTRMIMISCVVGQRLDKHWQEQTEIGSTVRIMWNSIVKSVRIERVPYFAFWEKMSWDMGQEVYHLEDYKIVVLGIQDIEPSRARCLGRRLLLIERRCWCSKQNSPDQETLWKWCYAPYCYRKAWWLDTTGSSTIWTSFCAVIMPGRDSGPEACQGLFGRLDQKGQERPIPSSERGKSVRRLTRCLGWLSGYQVRWRMT